MRLIYVYNWKENFLFFPWLESITFLSLQSRNSRADRNVCCHIAESRSTEGQKTALFSFDSAARLQDYIAALHSSKLPVDAILMDRPFNNSRVWIWGLSCLHIQMIRRTNWWPMRDFLLAHDHRVLCFESSDTWWNSAWQIFSREKSCVPSNSFLRFENGHEQWYLELIKDAAQQLIIFSCAFALLFRLPIISSNYLSYRLLSIVPQTRNVRYEFAGPWNMVENSSRHDLQIEMCKASDRPRTIMIMKIEYACRLQRAIASSKSMGMVACVSSFSCSDYETCCSVAQADH